MPPEIPFDEPSVRRLPLPLAQLYRRAHNAKTPQDRHLAAYFLSEAALKLLGCVTVVAYVDRVDVLAGRQLLYIGDVRKLTADRWLIDRYELRGEAVRRLEALDLPESEVTRRLQPEQLYLQLPTLGLQLLYPLAIYDGEMGE